MAKTSGRALLDTNVLVDATDLKRPRHQAVMTLLEQESHLVISAQVAREYLVVATRPARANGLGLSLVQALANLGEYRRVARMLPEEKPLLPALLKLLQAVPAEGWLLHDAHLVATMQVHGVKTLITSNPADFSRFQHLIRVVEP